MKQKTDNKWLLKKVETYCKEKGLRYTKPRRMTLEIIAASKRPVGAYKIIEEMAKVTQKPKPTTVYRAIDFLQQQGFIHKIESLNAFVICDADHTHQGSQFIVCHECGLVKEVHMCHLPDDVQKQIEAAGFKMDHWNTEIHGLCQNCQF